MSQLRIVLADDHEVVRSGLRALVDGTTGMGVVGEASDGAEAVRRARELHPDVLVMDVSMPVLDGAEATERIRRECPGVRVLALTMHEDRGHLTRLLRAGASGYLAKRAAADELVRAIQVVAGGGTYVDPLSDREEEVLREIAWGRSNKEIGERLGISTKTVETYKARIADKLGLRSRTDIVRFAVQQGWLSDR